MRNPHVRRAIGLPTLAEMRKISEEVAGANKVRALLCVRLVLLSLCGGGGVGKRGAVSMWGGGEGRGRGGECVLWYVRQRGNARVPRSLGLK